MPSFSEELIEAANDVLNDNDLSLIEKYEELEYLLLDEGYDMDEMTDLLLTLSWTRPV